MRRRMKKHESLASLRRKLYSALVMLLISSIMMVSTSYAWLVLSTAPEVTGIETQVGANGSLEIVLLNTETYNDVSLIADMDIDESAPASATSSNLTWGNLVDLSDSSYGLSEIILNPARLSIKQSGTNDSGDTQYAVNPSLLKTPVYAEDGRITGLEETAVSVIYKNNKFSYEAGNQDYGVRAIGTVSSMNEFQLSINSSRSVLVTSMSSAKTAASNSMSTYGSALANIAIQHALNSKGGSSEGESYSTSDVEALLGLAKGMKAALEYIDTGLRQVFVGYICTEESGVTSDDFQTAKAEIEDKNTSISSLKTTYAALITANSAVGDYIDKLVSDQSGVESAISTYEGLLSGGQTSFTWSEISTAMSSLVEYEKMTLNGKSVGEVSGMATSDIIALVLDGGLNVAAPTGSGLVSDIADFAGNYSANVPVEGFQYGSYTIPDLTAKISATTTYSPVHLADCSNILKGFTAGSNTTGGDVITDYFGYVLDFAFRTNVSDSNLLLQTEGTQRIYDDSTSSATQGGGSFMEFTSSAGLSATKMVKLMSGIRIAFVDADQDILAMAALDTSLGKDAYRVLTDEERAESDFYAVLTKGVTEQNSDYITLTEYEALPELSVVEFDSETGKVKAPLYLYNFSMTISTATSTDATEESETEEGETEDSGDSSEEGTTEVKYTGGITLGSKKDTNEILELPESRAQQVSAIVYLDGSYVNNSMVAANSSQSMSGILNLQFASDATLMPANNQELFDGPEEESGSDNGEDEETPDEDEETLVEEEETPTT